MHPRFLAATDFSESSFKALTLAAQYAKRYHGTLHVVHAIHYLGAAHSHEREDIFWEKESEAAQIQLAEAIGKYAKDVAQVQVHLIQGSPAEAILVFADELRADIIFAGSHGMRLAGDPFIGTEALRFLRHHQRPLMMVGQLPERREGQPNVLVPMSRSQGISGLTSFLLANQLGFQANFHLLHILEEGADLVIAQHFLERKTTQMQEAGASQVTSSLADYHEDGLAASINKHIRNAPEPYDLICVESNNPGRYGEMLVGGSLEDIILHCKRPVLCLSTTTTDDEA
jgi:nucleotide-binding universal stress UspA family protein